MMIRRSGRLSACFLIAVFSSVTSVGAATLRPGDLVVSEFMANPAAVSDTAGEWVEIFNTSTHAIDLGGLSLGDDASDDHQIATMSDLSIAPGDYLVLGRSAVAGEGADYVYDHFRLGNSRDEIVLRNGSEEIWRIDYDGSLALSGRSAELVSLGPTGAVYAPTPLALGTGTGDVATPGRAGTLALSVTAVPLPASLWLLASGLLGGVILRRGQGAGAVAVTPQAEG